MRWIKQVETCFTCWVTGLFLDHRKTVTGIKIFDTLYKTYHDTAYK